jgi:hypothetical protein
VSLLLRGGQHFTGEIIVRICRHYKLDVAEFKRLEYTDGVMTFIRQLCKDAGNTPFKDQSDTIKEMKISKFLLKKENVNLAAENSSLKRELKKYIHAAEIDAEKVRGKIYVRI